jgi:glycine betaine/proline transport system ATP-binding protein
VLRDVRDIGRDADGWIELQSKPVSVRLQLDGEGKVAAASVNGAPADWLSVEDASKDLPHDREIVFWSRLSTPLRHVMRAMQRDAGPVAVFDDEDHLVGCIGVRDVLTAVLRPEV